MKFFNKKKFGYTIGGIVAVLLTFYISLWIFSQETYEVNYGISFSHEHAASLGLEWKEVYSAMLNDLQPKYIRLAAPWSGIQPTEDAFYFDDIDWMLDQAAEAETKVILTVGQKAPRWPECHVPEWAIVSSTDEAWSHIETYIATMIERYKDHPSLEMWQVENEPYIGFSFGDCRGFHRSLVDDAVALVEKLDPEHPILMTDSGELGLWRRAASLGDYFGTTIYRVIRTPWGNKFTYDWLPAGWFKLKARITGVPLDKFFVSELQAEPWFHTGNPVETAVERQEETMNPTRMQKHIDFVKHLDVSRSYLWGVEWWYFMKEERDDARYWDIAREAVQK